MKTRLCFRAYAASLAVLLSAGLTGCELDTGSSGGGPGSCTDGFTFEDPSQVQYGSLTIDGDQNTNPEQATLNRTILHQFSRIAYPENFENGNDKGTAAYKFFSKKTENAIGFNRSQLEDDEGRYDRVRNRLDLLEALVVSGNVAPLQTARNAMANCVREDAPGSLRINSLKVREPAGEGDSEDTVWDLGINYAHNPSPLESPVTAGPNIARVVFTQESFAFTLYPNDTFSGIGPSSGFKQPSKLIAGFNAEFGETVEDADSDGQQESQNENTPSILFESYLAGTRDDQGRDRGETDRWSWSAPSQENATGAFSDHTSVKEAQCVKITADYSDDADSSRIKVGVGPDPCPTINSPVSFDPADTFSYIPNNINIRQRRD